jgi:hypothetical protein
VGALGFLQVRLDKDPSVAPNNGVDLNGTFAMNLTDPGTAMADGRIDRSEFQSGNLTDVFDASIDALFDIDGLRVSADAGLATTLGSIGIALIGDQLGDPGHVQSLADLENLPAEIVITAKNNSDFNHLTAKGVLAALKQFAAG